MFISFLFIFANCHKSDRPDYEKIGASSGNFGFQSILGETDSDDFDRIIKIKGATFAYRDKTTRVDSFKVIINDASIPDNYDSNELNYVPNKKYSFRIVTELGEASGSLKAPSVSRIHFVNLPDTHYTDQPLKIEWKYPDGESNNGVVIIDANGHNSGILPPESTSYTIPEKELENRTGSNQISVTSIRYVKFPNLINPLDNQVQFIEGLDNDVGSYFGVFTSTNRYVQVLRTDSQ